MNQFLNKVVNGIRFGLKPIKPVLVYIFEAEAWVARCWVYGAHKRLFYASWGIPRLPEFFDHQIDQFYYWRKSRNSQWLERGVYGSVAIKRDGTLLELACGDGFNTRNFYSGLVKSAVACDFDKKAISTASRKNNAPNIQYVLSDIRYAMPEGDFDNIVWDAAIEHFTPDEIEALMGNIKKRLSIKKGILSGYTLVEKDYNSKKFEHHECEFKSMDDLKRFFTPHFKNVIVFETIHPTRHNLYFWASDGVVPFSNGWEHWVKSAE